MTNSEAIEWLKYNKEELERCQKDGGLKFVNEECNDSMAMRHLCKRNGFDAFSAVTNADKIRQMSDEELADFLWSIGSSPFSGNVYLGGKYLFFTGDGNGWLDWLKQEVEE